MLAAMELGRSQLNIFLRPVHDFRDVFHIAEKNSKDIMEIVELLKYGFHKKYF